MSNESLGELEQKVVESVDNKLNTKVFTHTGQVKWFNNRLGYGFIKVVSDSDSHNDDIFVHQSHVSPSVSEWRSLRQGEYVSFNISTADGNRQAIDVRGVNGGSLLVDNITREDNRPRRNNKSFNPRTRRPYNKNTQNRPNTNSESGSAYIAPTQTTSENIEN